jgi:hypothetical protein
MKFFYSNLKRHTISYSFLLILLLTSCSKVFYSKDAVEISRKHKTIAIIPPKVVISTLLHLNNSSLKEQLKNESYIFQKEMYMWMLNKKNKTPYNFEVLDIEIVNSILKRSGYFSDTTSLTPFDMSKILGVDAVLSSNYNFARLIGNETIQTITDTSKSISANQNNSTRSTIINEDIDIVYSLYDLTTQKLIWNFDKKIRYSATGYSQNKIVKGIFKKAFKKMPYNSKTEKI